MFAWLLFSNKTANHLLVLFCKRAEAAKKSALQRDLTTINTRTKVNQVILIIMFRKKATNTSKAINTSFLSASSKTFFNFCHERFFNDTLARKN